MIERILFFLFRLIIFISFLLNDGSLSVVLAPVTVSNGYINIIVNNKSLIREMQGARIPTLQPRYADLYKYQLLTTESNRIDTLVTMRSAFRHPCISPTRSLYTIVGNVLYKKKGETNHSHTCRPNRVSYVSIFALWAYTVGFCLLSTRSFKRLYGTNPIASLLLSVILVQGVSL